MSTSFGKRTPDRPVDRRPTPLPAQGEFRMPSPFSILQGVGFVVLGYVLAKLVMGVLPFGQPQYLRFELQPLGAKAPNRIDDSFNDITVPLESGK